MLQVVEGSDVFWAGKRSWKVIAPFRIGSLTLGDMVFCHLVSLPFSGKSLVLNELASEHSTLGGVIGTYGVVAIGVVPGVHPGLLRCDCDPRIVSSTKLPRRWIC